MKIYYDKAAVASLFLLVGLTTQAVVKTEATTSLPSMEVVMRGGDEFEGMDYPDFPKYHNNRCTIRWPRDGNWATQNGFQTGGWDANQASQCTGYGNSDAMKYRLQRDGNFVARCGDNVDYATHTSQGGQQADYFMAIDDMCILHIYQGTFDCDSVHVEKELWTNIHLEPLKNGDRLGQGEFVRNSETGDKLLLQSNDGNLVLYASGGVLWSANDEWDGPPSRSEFFYWYARITHNGHLQLVGVKPDGQERMYFDKILNNYATGMDCFKVEYDVQQDDLVAVSCDGGSRRHRELRGSKQ